MPHRTVELNGKPLTIHKATTAPQFGQKTILVTDTWDYIDLWLKRHKHTQARFYWDQARSFFVATQGLPKESSPLTAYYCMLNAVKALLFVKRIASADHHGVSGETIGKKLSLTNEVVIFRGGGILAEFCRCINDPVGIVKYSLRDLLYNLPYVHRAFDLSVESSPELFIPIRNPRILRSGRTDEAWFSATLEGRYATNKTLERLPAHYERDTAFDDDFTIRDKRRFNWRPREKKVSLERYCRYHAKVRLDVHYIHSAQRLWYLKRNHAVSGHIARSTMSIAFASMHKLSELARYNPQSLARYFDGRYNWLLSEFIAISPAQFLDEISCEMTGQEFMPPGRIS